SQTRLAFGCGSHRGPALSKGMHDLSTDDRHPRPAREPGAAEGRVPALRPKPRGVDGPLDLGVEDRHVRGSAGGKAPARQAEEPRRVAREPRDERRERQAAAGAPGSPSSVETTPSFIVKPRPRLASSAWLMTGTPKGRTYSIARR